MHPSSVAQSFLESIKQKDKNKFLTFLNANHPPCGIFPDGKTAHGYQSFIDSQEHWFTSAGGSFEFEIVRTIKTNESFFSGADVSYTSPLNQTRHLYIGMLFHKHTDAWVLVHIQNTVITDHSKHR